MSKNQRNDEEEKDINTAVMVFAHYIGIDLDKEQDLLWIAEDAFDDLPEGWEVGIGEGEHAGIPFFYNSDTGESDWKHPNEGYYMKAVKKERQIKEEKAKNRVSSRKDEERDRSSLRIDTAGPRSVDDRQAQGKGTAKSTGKPISQGKNTNPKDLSFTEVEEVVEEIEDSFDEHDRRQQQRPQQQLQQQKQKKETNKPGFGLSEEDFLDSPVHEEKGSILFKGGNIATGAMGDDRKGKLFQDQTSSPPLTKGSRREEERHVSPIQQQRSADPRRDPSNDQRRFRDEQEEERSKQQQHATWTTSNEREKERRNSGVRKSFDETHRSPTTRTTVGENVVEDFEEEEDDNQPFSTHQQRRNSQGRDDRSRSPAAINMNKDRDRDRDRDRDNSRGRGDENDNRHGSRGRESGGGRDREMVDDRRERERDLRERELKEREVREREKEREQRERERERDQRDTSRNRRDMDRRDQQQQQSRTDQRDRGSGSPRLSTIRDQQQQQHQAQLENIEISHYKNEISRYERMIADVRFDNNRLLDDLATNKQHYSQDVSSLKEEIASLTDKLYEEKRENKLLQDKLSAYGNDSLSKQKDIEERCDVKHKETIRKLSLEHSEEMNEKLKTLERKHFEEMEVKNSEIVTLKRKNDDISRDYEFLKRKSFYLKEDTKQEILKEFDELKTKYRQLEEEYFLKTQEIKKLNDELLTEKSKEALLYQDLQKVIIENESLKLKNKTILEETTIVNHSQLLTLDKGIKLEQEISTLKAEMTILQKEKDSLEIENRKLKSLQTVTKDQSTNYESDLRRLKISSQV
jgi:hypothetical protein